MKTFTVQNPPADFQKMADLQLPTRLPQKLIQQACEELEREYQAFSDEATGKVSKLPPELRQPVNNALFVRGITISDAIILVTAAGVLERAITYESERAFSLLREGECELFVEGFAKLQSLEYTLAKVSGRVASARATVAEIDAEVRAVLKKNLGA